MKKPDQITLGLIILAVVLLPLLVLVLLGRDFIYQAVILPVEYAFWLGNLAIRAVPQSIFWFIFCVVAAYIMVSSLFSGGSDTLQSEKRTPERTARERVAFWTLQLQLAKGGDYSRLRFADFISKLILDILSYSGRITLDEYQAAMQKGSLDLPLPVLAFLKARLTPIYALGPHSSKERWRLRWLRLKEVFQLRARHRQAGLGEEEVQQVVQYLENELEVDRHHDEY